MSRYIDADELTKYPWFVEIHGETIDDIAEQIIEACKHIVISAPSIDIVRCKECKHWRAYETWSECELWTDDPYESAKTKADDFCSYGERSGE